MEWTDCSGGTFTLGCAHQMIEDFAGLFHFAQCDPFVAGVGFGNVTRAEYDGGDAGFGQGGSVGAVRNRCDLMGAAYGIVVFMSVATTIVAPPLIKMAYQGLLESGQAEVPEEAFRLG